MGDITLRWPFILIVLSFTWRKCDCYFSFRFWSLVKRYDHGSWDVVRLNPSTVMISNQFPVLFFKGLFWKRMQDVVEPTRFICFPLCFISFQGNYNWTRARSGSFEHPNFGYRMREVPIFGGTSIPPNGGTHWPTSRIVRGRVNGLERSSG